MVERMAEVRLLEWVHDGDTVIAEVGQPIKWGRPGRTGRIVSWKRGRTVRVIDMQGSPTIQVWLDRQERPDYWNDPIYVGPESVRRTEQVS